jgi:hypothetical protein
MIRIAIISATLITLGSAFGKLPLRTWEPRFKTNSDKYRAILLDINFEDDPLDTWEARRSYQSHFLMRTSSTPLGPGLNSGSFAGIVDQQMPLVGYDLIQAGSPRGYWPLFATTKATLYVDQSSSHWVNVYSSSGAADSVMCDDGEVIIGIRYSSHKNAAQFAPNQPVSEIPDIQCARLQETAQVQAVDITSVNDRNVTVDASGGGTIKTTQSVMDVKQCMLDKTSNFPVQDRGATFNTCYGKSGSGTVSRGNVLLFEYLMSLRVDEEYKRHNPDSPMMIDFMIRQEKPVTADELFGTDDDKADSQLKASIQASKDTAINQAQAQYQANWGTTVDIQATINELGDKPWSSDKLIAGSAEFVSGSLTSGMPMQIVRGFISTGDPSFPVGMICGSVIGCAHGTCQKNQCVCKPGFTGGACTDRLDPCGDNPCGTKGRCVENFNSTDSSNSKQYKCTCNDGFFGDNCEKSSDVCIELKDGFWSNVNCGQGSCVPNNGTLPNVSAPSISYTCSCFPGYSTDGTGICNQRKIDCVGQWTALNLCDSNCQQKEVFRISVPAEGSGTQCLNIEGDARTSLCTGGNCKKCMSRDCNGRGKCSDGTGQCVCSPGWTGSNCEQSTDICSATLCSGHGNCNDLQTSCTCINGWKSQTGASSKFCDQDPCAGCPPGNCNTDTGTCACPDDLPPGQWPACGMGSTDCLGNWGPWTSCSATCEQKRYYSISLPASNGGQTCPQKAGDFQSQKCSSGMCCTLKASDCMNGSDYDSATCLCRSKPGFQGDKCEYTSTVADRIVTKEIKVDAATMALFNTTARPEVTYEQATMAAEATTAPPASTNMMYIYIGAGVAGLLVIGGAAWYFMKKKPAAPTDPLLAGMEGMEGMEGMDLTGMDLSALGMDPNAPNMNPL